MNKKEVLSFSVFVVVITIFSVFNTGYNPPEVDDASSTYLSMANLKEDPDLYKNDFYIQAIKGIPADPFTPIARFHEPSISEGDWGEVILFSLDTDKNDLFAIPVFSGEQEYSPFRFLAQRAVFLEWKGTGASVYAPSLVPEIRKRFIDYCKVDIEDYNDRGLFVKDCKKNYEFMADEDFRLLNIKYNVKYLIENKQEVQRRLSLPVAMENEKFIIYYLGDINEKNNLRKANEN